MTSKVAGCAIWKDWMSARQPVVGNDHPLSIGWVLYFFTTDPRADANSYITEDQLKEIFPESDPPAGFHAQWTNNGVAAIFTTERDIPLRRVVELVVHESSHFIDAMFERTCADPCTETRAYYLDWVVGKIIGTFDGMNNVPTVPASLPANVVPLQSEVHDGSVHR